MAFKRANPFLEEIIEILQMHLDRYQGDTNKAREYLSAGDSQWIDDELLKCMTEPRYFISNYYAIKTEDQGYRGLYPFFDSQEILHDNFRRLEKTKGKVKGLVLKARQMGSTTYISAETFAKTVFTPHANTIIVAQNERQATYVLDMYAAAWDFLPWWMKPRVRYNVRGEFIDFDEKDDNLRETRPGLKSRIYADNGNKPTGAGRGMTFRRAHLTELPQWTNGTQLTKSLFPTFNSPDGFYVLESTANGRNDFWHNLWRRAEAEEIDWEPIFIPFYRREKTYSLPIAKNTTFVLTEDEKLMRQNVLLKEGYTIPDTVFNWRRNKIQEFIATDGDDMMFNQEYASNPEEAFQSGANTAYPRPIINKLMKRCMNPLWVGEITYDFKAGRPVTHVKAVDPHDNVPYPKTENRFHIWEKPIAGAVYCIGIDVSLGNEGQDYSCCQVLKVGKGHQKDEQVAVWHGLINPFDLATIVFAIGWLYNEAMVAVEVNSIGQSTNSELVRNLEYENVYRYKRMDRLKNFLTDIMGFWTDYKSKRALMTTMSKYLLDDLLTLRDKHTVNEFYDFNDDYEADGKGAHDDYLMALHIALYCAHEGEFKEDQSKPPETDAQANVFEVKDRFGTIVATTTSQDEAQRVSKRWLGSTTVRTAGATTTVIIAGTKRRVPSDYQNTDWSPVFDGDGTASKMYEDGIAPEDITPEAIAEYEAQMEEDVEDPQAWLYS